ncbi:MAG: SGNH/GDSL hydrolase family protein [Caldithrix sp.]|nr:MAG: SGNH/GDSL hydrolase family protein [Caldithrix sp.]
MKTQQRNGAMKNRPISRKKELFFTAILLLLSLSVCAGLYLSTIVWRSNNSLSEHSRWRHFGTYRPDENYGSFPKPDTLTYHSLENGERVPAIFDKNGFRIPFGEDEEHVRSSLCRILFLGGSFTHGNGVLAEKTFAYLTANALNASAMNAGGAGWGLSQMVLRARDVIPRLKPDIVVVQYSNWLPGRSLRFYTPTNWGKVPAPYFYESGGIIGIHQPVFQSVNFKVPISEFAGEGLPTFLWKVGIPLFIQDDYLVLRTALKSRLGTLDLPITSREKAVNFAYKEIQQLCSSNGARMLILVIPGGINDHPKDSLDAFSWRVVRTLEPLTRRLPEPTPEAWAASYKFWRGYPPRIVDHHPSARMHAAIAETLIGAIRQFEYDNQLLEPNKALQDAVNRATKLGHGTGHGQVASRLRLRL